MEEEKKKVEPGLNKVVIAVGATLGTRVWLICVEGKQSIPTSKKK